MLFGKVAVTKGVTSEIDAILEQDASFFIEKSKSSQVVQNVSFSETIEAPTSKGAVIGEITYSVDNKVIKKVNIVASETVQKLGLVNMTLNIWNKWFNLLR